VTNGKIPLSAEGGEQRWLDVQFGDGQQDDPRGHVQWSPDAKPGADVQRAPGYEHFKLTIMPPVRPY